MNAFSTKKKKKLNSVFRHIIYQLLIQSKIFVGKEITETHSLDWRLMALVIVLKKGNDRKHDLVIIS